MIVTIRYGNIKSTCITRLVYKELYKLLSIKDKNFFWAQKSGSRWDGYHRFFSDITGKFPTGLISIVLKHLKQKGYEVKITGDLPEKIEYKDININGITLRDYQKEGVQRGCKFGRGIFGVATNGGKTEIIAALILEINKPTIILVHTKVIFTNMVKRLKKRINKKIGYVNAEGIVVENVTVCMIQSCYTGVTSTLGKTTMQLKPEIKNILKSFDVIMIDEGHHSKSTTWYKLLMSCSARYRFGFTGTPDMKDKANAVRLRASTGPVIYRIKNDFLIDQGFSAVPEVRILDLPTIVDLSVTYGDYYKNHIVNNIHRNEIIKNICLHHKKNILILVNRVVHGVILEQLILGSAFIHGESKDVEDVKASFEREDVKTLIATQILDEGADIPSIDVLILAVGTADKNKLLQRVGRGLRAKKENNKVIIYDFEDTSKYLRAHARARQKVYKTEGFKVIRNYKIGG